MSGLQPEAWETFAVGQLGASAALLGLVFVGISINLQNVLSSRRLVNRAAESVVLLFSLLVGSTAVLVPAQESRLLGAELLVLGLMVLGAVVVLERSRATPTGEVATPSPAEDGTGGDGPGYPHVVRRILGVGAALFTVIAGVSLLADAGGGLSWWVGAVVLAYAGAVLGGWVLLVEILR